MDFIWRLVKRLTSASTALKSERAATGCVSFHLPLDLLYLIVLAGVVTPSYPISARLTVRTALSRRSKVVLLKVVSTNDGISTTLFWSSTRAYRSLPGGVFRPISSL